MAQRVQTLLVSDLSGEELGTDGQTLKFGWLGAEYEIDLSQKEADQFAKDLEKYLSAARRVGGRQQRGTGRAKTDPAQLKAIREWANSNGYNVSSRGRVPQEIQDAYNASKAS